MNAFDFIRAYKLHHSDVFLRVEGSLDEFTDVSILKLDDPLLGLTVSSVIPYLYCDNNFEMHPKIVLNLSQTTSKEG